MSPTPLETPEERAVRTLYWLHHKGRIDGYFDGQCPEVLAVVASQFRARDAALVEELARRLEADQATTGEFPYVNFYGASGWLRSQPEAKGVAP